MIYLDNAATTAVFKEVLDSLEDYYKSYFANPSSIHKHGQKVRHVIERSRYDISQILKVNEEEVFFTSCATESNNTIIFGLADLYPEKNHIVVSPIEHKSVLNPLKKLSSKGYKIDFIKVDKDGVIDIDHLKSLISEKTLIVIVMHGNNETGVVQDIRSIGKLCKEKDVLFFSDIVQSFLKEDIDTDYVDFLSVSGHKINAPKGIGLMFKRKDLPLSPLIYGGGQEKGLRSGTENPQLILALADSAKIWKEKRGEFVSKLKSLRDYFEDRLRQEIEDISIVSGRTKRLPHISNIIFPKLDAQSLVMGLDSYDVCVSSGSACSSGTPAPSHVLSALGYSEKEALSSVRFSFGVDIDYNQIEQVIEMIKNIYRELSFFF